MAPGSTVRTIFGQTDLRKRPMEAPGAEDNPLLQDTNRATAAAAFNAQRTHLNSGTGSGSWSNLAQVRGQARRNGTLLSNFPLVYSSFVSTLGTWLSQADMAARIRVKENASFLTWVECFGYQLEHGEDDFAKLPDDVKKDLERQWTDYGARRSQHAAQLNT